MRKIISLIAILSLFLFASSCNKNAQGVELPEIAQKAISDTSFIYYDNFSYFSEDFPDLPIGMFDSSVEGLFVVEKFLTIDQFDNITGKPVPDGIPDFGGENFQFLVDKANGPYIDYMEAGNIAFLKEHLMANIFFLMGESFYTLPVDDFKSGQKERVKAVISLANTADYAVGEDVSNFTNVCGSNVLSIGLMSSGINALFQECLSQEELCVGILSSGDDITVREYESAIRQKAQTLNYGGSMKIIGQRAHGLSEAILMDYDYVSMLTNSPRSNYKGPDVVSVAGVVDDVVLDKYNFNEAENGLLYIKRGDRYEKIQLNSIENYVRFHIVSMVEHHRSSGSKVPISYILLSDYKYSSVKHLIVKTLEELYNYKQDGMYLYRNSISSEVVLIDPVECAAKDCYISLRKSQNLALRAVRSELDAYIVVPALSLEQSAYDSQGFFTQDFRVSRPAGEYKITSKIVPFSTRYVDQNRLNYMGTYFPVSYSLVKNSLY